jgi:hypothetical protein
VSPNTKIHVNFLMMKLSEADSDLGLDQQAIQHLVGDIAEDVLRMEGGSME